MKWDDAFGMFWEDPERVRARSGPDPNRPLPPTPDTGWKMPTEFPDLRGHGMIAFDCETKEEDLVNLGPGFYRGSEIVGIAIGTEAGYRQYFPVGHEHGPNLDRGRVFDWASEQLSRPNQPKVGANLQYDYIATKSSGIKVTGPFYDVQISTPLLDENKLKYDLDGIAEEWLGENKVDDELYQWLRDAFGDVSNIKKHIWRAPPAVAGPYAEGDVDLPLRIFRLQKPQLEKQGLWDLFANVESPLIPMLGDMHIRGTPVDRQLADRLNNEWIGKEQEAIDRLKEIAGVEVNVAAADSIARAYDNLGLKYPRTEKKGKPSFTKEWLEHSPYPISKAIVDVRHMTKFRKDFIQKCLIEKNHEGVLHTSFRQLKGSSGAGGTVSGRFASGLPNLQNIPNPKRTVEGRLIRSAFIPEEGCDWWKFDWSQVEYRLIVHYASLTGQYKADEVVERYLTDASVDYHQLVADMTGLSREDAKNLNFGLAYGQGVDLLCENLGVDRMEGERIITQYHQKAPFIRPLMGDVSRRADKVGFIRTILGRRRRFDVYEKRGRNGIMEYRDEWSPGYRRAFLHKALNALIQGSAADVMKKAMVEIYTGGVTDVLGVPHLTVHDELDYSAPRTRAAREALREVKRIMENAVNVKVPLVAEVEFGLNWGNTKKVQEIELL